MFRTPLIPYAGIFLKCEHLLPGGSYKARGVESFLESLPAGTKRVRVLSAGNMARTLALLAGARGIEVEALVPESIPELKRRKLESLGVALIPIPFEKLWSEVDRPSPTPYPLLHPFDSVDLLTGYGRIASELLSQRKGLTEVVVPIGVGGLASGLARALPPHVRLVLAENEDNAPFHQGKTIERKPSWIDAIGTPYVLERVRSFLTPRVHEVRTVRSNDALAAGRRLYESTGYLVEGAAAVALAAARTPHSVAILTGENLDPAIYRVSP